MWSKSTKQTTNLNVQLNDVHLIEILDAQMFYNHNYYVPIFKRFNLKLILILIKVSLINGIISVQILLVLKRW